MLPHPIPKTIKQCWPFSLDRQGWTDAGTLLCSASHRQDEGSKPPPAIKKEGSSPMSKFCIAALCAFLLPSLTANAEVIRFEVLQSGAAFEGRSFGSVGPYVKITARATIAVDPADPRNAIIADIDKAPRDEKGLVEATADVVLLRPADPLRANGTLLVDIPNRGTKLAPQLFDDSVKPGSNDAEKAADAGIGFLHGQGYTMAWIGWQADIPSKPGQLALRHPSCAA
jgi:hypothetical protein